MNVAEGTFAGLAGEELALFQSCLRGLNGQAVEIGCLDGFSTAHILDYSSLHLTSIDPFIPDSMAPSLIGSRARFDRRIQERRARDGHHAREVRPPHGLALGRSLSGHARLRMKHPGVL